MDNLYVEEKKSIFQRIETLVRTTGELPEDFEPEKREYAENELRFAPGAMEGILGHHSLGEGEADEFAQTLKTYLDMDSKEALEQFEETKPFRVAGVRDSLLQEILNHQNEYPAAKIANLGYYFACQGNKCESVKLGLSLLALFDFSENEQVCIVLRYLGYCEEFTDYVIMSVESWEEDKKQNLYFELAKKLKGWGKISVVEQMRADTEEKKEWILCHGCRNSVLNAYLAYVCAKQCDFLERLKKGNLTNEQLQGAGDIMEGLLDEGPCAGMSAVEQPEELTLYFLQELERHVLKVEEVQLLCQIKDYFVKRQEKYEEAGGVVKKADHILDGLDIQKLLEDTLQEKPHTCVYVAGKLDVDITKPLFRLMQENFSEYYHYCSYFFQKEQFIEPFFTLCDREVDASRYPKGMSDSLGLGNLGEGILHLDFIVQYLGKYPLKGRKLLAISIQSPYPRWRNMAGRAMVAWTENLKQPLQEIDAGLYHMVKDVAEIECNKTTKEYWDKLL